MSKARVFGYLFYLMGGIFLVKYFVFFQGTFAVFAMGCFSLGQGVFIIKKLKKICKLLEKKEEKPQ